MELPAIVQTYLDAYNRRDVAALIACVSDDVVFENVSNSGQSTRLEGREAFSQLAHQAAGAFLERQQVVRTAVVNGDSIALEINWTGTPKIDLGPMKAGDQASMRGASFFTVSAGKLRRIVDIS